MFVSVVEVAIIIIREFRWGISCNVGASAYPASKITSAIGQVGAVGACLEEIEIMGRS